jgi:peroxiredoxin
MALRVGQYAPDFVLVDHRGENVRLSDFLGRKNVVIAFFPLAWTPI